MAALTFTPRGQSFRYGFVPHGRPQSRACSPSPPVTRWRETSHCTASCSSRTQHRRTKTNTQSLRPFANTGPLAALMRGHREGQSVYISGGGELNGVERDTSSFYYIRCPCSYWEGFPPDLTACWISGDVHVPLRAGS
ncbi:hypothetical protein K505DRAFT_77307 [Melanomma pulvis-pyrius CBS 109.77]|uniref:Uncharacterized protein n=1 Tax=Melanomma pulvis-pyrius CBS 109.77 TaxID=1314802 RepID=A0A6A6X2S9_9PLEO|nr:hypothetical protein K505DRAFT_77307 [Melanomma pulvis-pyrius CBS 109.77]